MSPRLDDILEGENFPYALTEAKGEDVEETLEKERRRGNLEGYTPLLVGAASDVEMLVQVLAARQSSAEEVLEASENVNVDAWLADREFRFADRGALPIGQWPEDAISAPGLRSHRDVISGRIEDVVYIARIPTKVTWEVLAYLGLGGWDDFPSPEVQVALSRRWWDDYEARIVALTVDLVEYQIGQPPSERPQAERLARQHYLYAPEVAAKSQGGILGLAARLLDGKYWHFWWE